MNDVQINDEIKRFQQMRIEKQEEEDSEIKSVFENARKATNKTMSKNGFDSDENEDYDYDMEKATKTTKSSRRKESDDDEDDFDKELATKPARGRGKYSLSVQFADAEIS